MVHCSLLFGIDCYFVVFIYYFSKCRPFAEVGCGVRLTAVQMPRKPARCGIFLVSEAADAVSREVECLIVDLAIVSCSLDDQYIQYSAKRGLSV